MKKRFLLAAGLFFLLAKGAGAEDCPPGTMEVAGGICWETSNYTASDAMKDWSPEVQQGAIELAEEVYSSRDPETGAVTGVDFKPLSGEVKTFVEGSLGLSEEQFYQLVGASYDEEAGKITGLNTLPPQPLEEVLDDIANSSTGDSSGSDGATGESQVIDTTDPEVPPMDEASDEDFLPGSVNLGDEPGDDQPTTGDPANAFSPLAEELLGDATGDAEVAAQLVDISKRVIREAFPELFDENGEFSGTPEDYENLLNDESTAFLRDRAEEVILGDFDPDPPEGEKNDDLSGGDDSENLGGDPAADGTSSDSPLAGGNDAESSFGDSSDDELADSGLSGGDDSESSVGDPAADGNSSDSPLSAGDDSQENTGDSLADNPPPSLFDNEENLAGVGTWDPDADNLPLSQGDFDDLHDFLGSVADSANDIEEGADAGDFDIGQTIPLGAGAEDDSEGGEVTSIGETPAAAVENTLRALGFSDQMIEAADIQPDGSYDQSKVETGMQAVANTSRMQADAAAEEGNGDGSWSPTDFIPNLVSEAQAAGRLPGNLPLPGQQQGQHSPQPNTMPSAQFSVSDLSAVSTDLTTNLPLTVCGFLENLREWLMIITPVLALITAGVATGLWLLGGEKAGILSYVRNLTIKIFFGIFFLAIFNLVFAFLGILLYGSAGHTWDRCTDLKVFSHELSKINPGTFLLDPCDPTKTAQVNTCWQQVAAMDDATWIAYYNSGNYDTTCCNKNLRTAGDDTTLFDILLDLKAFLVGIVGTIGTIMMLIGGIQYTSATGPDGATKARNTIMYAAFGIIGATCANLLVQIFLELF